MTIKPDVWNKIRGWFPQEPNSKLAIDTVHKQQTLNSYNYNKRASPIKNKALLSNIPLWSLWLFTFSVHLSIINFSAALAFGVFIGILLGTAPTYRELRKLYKTGKSNVKLSEISFISLMIAALCFAFGSLIGQGTFHITEFQYTILTFSCISLLVTTLTKASFFAVWERKNKANIMRGKGYEIFSTPKTPRTPYSPPRYFFGRELKQ